MLKLKDKITFRCETEKEAKELGENFKEKGKSEGFTVNKFSYQLRERKEKKEVVESCYQVEIELLYASIWG